MRRLLIAFLLMLAPALFAQVDKSGGTAAHGAEKEMHEQAHPGEGHAQGAEHHEQTYFGIPGWILKLANMLLFLGVLGYFIGGPIKKGLAARREQIRRDAEEARARRERADRMAGEIQARLSAIEAEVRAIHERAQAEGERQKRELVVAAEAESQKIVTAARTEVDNRLKHARTELTEYAAQLASDRAEQILREKMTDDDRAKLFRESLREVGEVRT